MFPRLLVIASIVFLSAAGLAFSQRHSLTTITAKADKAADEPLASPHRSEQEWIVADVVGAIAGMAEYARTGKPGATDVVTASLDPLSPLVDPAKQPPAFSIRYPGHAAPLKVTIARGIWQPVDYAALASRLFGSSTRPPRPGIAPLDAAMLSALTSPRASVLLAQNARISRELTADMRSARAHEQAALLLGVFALREAAGMFDDVRSTLSRMTAHLACAEVLRGADPQSAEGFLAETILLHLAGYQSDAMAGLESVELATAPEPLRVWIRALTLRITGDWRAMTNARDATLLERLEYARAVHDRLGPFRLQAVVAQSRREQISDWQHIVLQKHFTVQSGNQFTGDPLALDLQEAQEVWSAFHDGAFTGRDAIGRLNDNPWLSPVREADGKSVVHVIDWGRWAGFFQRHLCEQLTALATQDWMLSLGTEAKAETLRTAADRFGGLSLYPIVLRTSAVDEADYRRGMEGANALVRQHPERVSAAAWYRLEEKPNGWTAKAIAPVASWFTVDVLPGALFDQNNRGLRLNHTAPLATLEQWKVRRPYDSWLLYALAFSRGEQEALAGRLKDDRPTFASTVEILGPLLDYDIMINSNIEAHLRLTTAQSIEVPSRMCEADADRCELLGLALLRADRDADAAKAFERWAGEAQDRVGVANGLTWLVRYYADNNRLDRATKLAEMAAETGAGSGLETLAELLDRQGEHQLAEGIYKRIADRYENNGGYLGAFYRRMARRSGDAAYETRAATALKEDFKDGIERVSPAMLTKAPVDGMRVGRVGPRARRLGVQDNDIVVAVDGVRIHSSWQYQLALRFGETSATSIELVVWRDGRYQTLKLDAPQRWLGVDLETYAATK
jgi:tetratricopeptide (TPR) repeat protein